MSDDDGLRPAIKIAKQAINQFKEATYAEEEAIWICIMELAQHIDLLEKEMERQKHQAINRAPTHMSRGTR